MKIFLIFSINLVKDRSQNVLYPETEGVIFNFYTKDSTAFTLKQAAIFFSTNLCSYLLNPKPHTDQVLSAWAFHEGEAVSAFSNPMSQSDELPL